MALNTGLTTLHEDEIAKHQAVAQSLVTKLAILERDDGAAGTPLAGTGRRFVSTVSTGGQRRSREVELARTIQAVRSADPLLSPAQHAVLYRTRRGIQVALAVSDVFARQTNLEQLQARNATAPLAGEDAAHFKALLSASAYIAAFTLAAYIGATLQGEGEPVDDAAEPDFLFDTPQGALKSMIAGLDRSLAGASDELALTARSRAFARVVLEGLVARKARFTGLQNFESVHIRLDQDNFTLNGFDVTPGQKRKPLVMTFKKPEEIIGNHIAKYQALKLAKMLMAYDFDRQMNPFVELGGFLFTFIGDGMPGTGKTILIQMLAGMLHDYCGVAGYAFHYENFGVDQISSYQGKSGQNCKEFINNVMNPRAIGFGTVDDVDQVAAKRSDDRASAGQHEVTAVLMESFAGASTVVRGNCTFGMFSNYPENVDDALRQRAGARWLVDGPQTEDDYIDIFALLVGKNHQIPLGEHELYAGQEIKRAVSQSYAAHGRPQEEGLAAVWERYEKEKGKIATLADVGAYLHMIKEAEPRFTGRAIRNITDAVKLRAMDIELPDDWFKDPAAFMHKPYDEKTAMIEELRGPITIDMVLQEINRYADSEFRYTDKSDDAAVAEIIRRERQREKAIREIETMKREGRWQG
ncbi:ATP-binding protein [Sinorhizobium medicae]|uniref:AAA family ATPase n=1 Tax=Sinorhizobium medicae TaxID=110321 RepID=UPI000FD4AC84|nr:AAA family ATPase [Sinorhizobium medicae]MQY00518.1 AAA family ATPase [Sinorhizobium medicae]RVH88819.1 ATP-binding protein [Sinorhizobium medicae]RVJ59595.1 ATP-binding protein [Sinorhizobium medicae]RVJ74838.1 ATP-binding protein [Sinorhizobium medicae]RVK22058.1 ATP-binding protein [Sinorhizobium medicae]